MVDHDLVPLSLAQIKTKLKQIPGWEFESDKLTKQFTFNSFTEAIQFINGLVGFCNYLDHHPDILVSYKKIRFELTRFSVGGKVTSRDFTVAHKIEEDFQKYITKKVS